MMLRTPANHLILCDLVLYVMTSKYNKKLHSQALCVAFPIGIDSKRFIRALEQPQVQEHIKELKERFAGRKVMLGVDRIDMIKGIPQKILAFEKFLEENSSWREGVVLLQIVVLTRTDVPECMLLFFAAFPSALAHPPPLR